MDIGFIKPVLKIYKKSGIADFSSVSFETGVFLREGSRQSQARLQLATAHEPKMKRSGIVVAKFLYKESSGAG